MAGHWLRLIKACEAGLERHVPTGRTNRGWVFPKSNIEARTRARLSVSARGQESQSRASHDPYSYQRTRACLCQMTQPNSASSSLHGPCCHSVLSAIRPIFRLSFRRSRHCQLYVRIPRHFFGPALQHGYSRNSHFSPRKGNFSSLDSYNFSDSAPRALSQSG
jgi:hypothetical protein